MSDTIESLRHQIHSAGQLRSVVHTTKTLAASSIGQYERSVRALANYCQTIELGLRVCLRQRAKPRSRQAMVTPENRRRISAVVFGSDQGPVGRFNDSVAEYAVVELEGVPRPVRVWAVGDRVVGRLVDAGLPPEAVFPVPSSVQGITPLVEELLVVTGGLVEDAGEAELHLV